MAWYETYKIGCGMRTDCLESDPRFKYMLYIVCHYDPGYASGKLEILLTYIIFNFHFSGNMLNDPIYESGEPCSKCKRYPGSKCEKNLCAGGGPG